MTCVTDRDVVEERQFTAGEALGFISESGRYGEVIELDNSVCRPVLETLGHP